MTSVLRKKFFFSAIASVAFVALAAALLLSWGSGSDTAQAAHDPVTAATAGEDVGFDMLIAGNGPGTLGAIDNCVSVTDDGTAAADFDFDVFLDGIPAANDMAGVELIIGAKPGHSLGLLTVVAYDELTGGINILTNQGTGVTLTFSDVPPKLLDGYTTSVTDLGPPEAPAVTIRGVATRYGVDVGATAPGLYPMVFDVAKAFESTGAEFFDPGDQLSNGSDEDGDTLTDEDSVIDGFDGFGLIAVDVPCPGGADLKNLDFTAELAAPDLSVAGEDSFSSTVNIGNIMADLDLDGVPETAVGPAALSGPTKVTRTATGDTGPITAPGANALDDIQTEIVSMSLTGITGLGALTMIEDPGNPSYGFIEEQVNGTAGTLEFPADSDFNVMVILKGTPFGPLFATAPHPLSTPINAIPPLGETYTSVPDLTLVDLSLTPRLTLQGISHTVSSTPAVDVSVENTVFLTETIHNNGPETLVTTDLDITCAAPESIINAGTPGGQCSFHVTADLYLAPYVGPLVVSVDGVVQATDPAVGSVFTADWPDTLEVSKVVDLNQSVTEVLVEEWDLKCFEPSTHTWNFQKQINPQSQFVPELDDSDNSGSTSLTVDCIGEADLKILSQTVTSSFGTNIIGADGFDNDGDAGFWQSDGLDNDGDTLIDESDEGVDEDGVGDCDGDGNADDDGDTNIDEDGGMCPVINIDKSIHNNGPIDAAGVITKFAIALDATGSPLPSKANGGCDLTFLSSDPTTVNLVVSVGQIHNEQYVLDCANRGAFVDDDGDALIDSDADTVPDAPCNGIYVGNPQCFNYIDEDPPDGADNDGDGLVDEDGPVSITVIGVDNLIVPEDPHIVDPDLSNNENLDTSLVILDYLPFDPTYTTLEDEVDADTTAPPVDNDCLITLPCKIMYSYAIPGGNPLANVVIGIPGDDPATLLVQEGYTKTRATVLGATIAKVNAVASVSFLSGPCNPGSFVLGANLLNGAFPLGMADLVGQQPNDTPDPLSALANPFSWATHLDSTVALYAPYVLQSREANVANVAGTLVPINVLVFDGTFFNGGYLKVLVIGDPDDDNDGIIDPLDPDDDNDGIPDYADVDFDNDATKNENETLSPIPGGGMCSPLIVDLIELGATSAAQGGEVLTVCNEIDTAPGHQFSATFTRADIGTTDTVLHNQTCSGENDVSQTLTKDENVGDGVSAAQGVDDDGDTAVDEDPVDGIDNDGDSNVDEDDVGDPVLAIGLTQGIEVDVTITNGIVPSAVAEELSIVSRDPCVAEWDAASLGGDGTQANVVLDPLITVGPTHISVLNWTEQGDTPAQMDAFESVTVTAKYMITCSGPSTQTLQIESNAVSTPPLPDPNPLDNEAMNNPVITAGNDDVDGDGVLNAVDNSPLAANADQLDTDGDGQGDASDHDDDGDGIDDAVDACPTLAEDPGLPADGCPETDLVISVAKDNPIDVDVSEDTLFTVTTTATNGDYGLYAPAGVTFLELLKSNITNPADNCQARWIPQPGDLWSEDTFVETFDGIPDQTVLYSFLQTTVELPPFNSVDKVREYTLHCNARSDHRIFLEEGILPTFPVQDPNASNNVEKQYIDIEAWDVVDVKIITADVESIVSTGQPRDTNGDSTVDDVARVDLQVKKVLHNNGPTDVSVSIGTGTSVPPDCTFVDWTFTYPGGATVDRDNIDLPVSTQVTLFEDISYDCTDKSDHQFEVENNIYINEVHVRDTDLSNNILDTTASVAITGITTLGLSVDTSAIPTEGDVSVSETFPIITTISNTGSFDAQPGVSQTLSGTGSNADDCTVSFHVTAPFLAAIVGGGQGLTISADGLVVDPPTPAGWEPSDVVISDLGGTISISYDADVASHGSAVLTNEWDNHCFAPSFHDFSLSTSVTDDGNALHVEHNDASSSDPFTQAIFADADLKIADWFFLGNMVDLGSNAWLTTPPPLDDNLDGDSKEKLHNNGPFGPIDSALTITATADAGCTVNYEVSGNESAVNGGAVPAAGTIVQLGSVEFSLDLPVSVDVWIAERFGFEIDEHVWECGITLDKTLNQTDGHIRGGGDTAQETITVCADTDQDGVEDQCSVTGQQDNCQVDANPGQEDSDGDGIGNACDARADHDLVVNYCLKLGPAPVNLSDNAGSYMWILCEIGNFSDHDEVVDLSEVITGNPAGCEPLEEVTILPGQDTILLQGQWLDNDGDTLFNEDPPDGLDNDGDSLIDEDGPDGEQKIILYRARFECHAPVAPDIYAIQVDVTVDHVNHTDALDDDGDTVADEDPIDGIDNDGDSLIDEDPPEGDAPPTIHSQDHQIIVSDATP